MEQVLKLDKDCEEAANDLINCKVLQLMVKTPTNYMLEVFPVRLLAGNCTHFRSKIILLN